VSGDGGQRGNGPGRDGEFVEDRGHPGWGGDFVSYHGKELIILSLVLFQQLLCKRLAFEPCTYLSLGTRRSLTSQLGLKYGLVNDPG
jgi:hypothetical protein